MAFVTLYCRKHWNTNLHLIVIPMTGKVMLAVFFGFSVVMGIASGHFAVVFADVGGVLVGWMASAGGIGRWIRDLRTRREIAKARKHLKVVPKRPEDKQWIN